MSDAYLHESSSQSPDAVLTVEAAIANLQSPDLSQRYYAAWWLGKMRAHEAVDALLEALADSEDRTELGGYPLRRNAARALGKLRDCRAIPALINSLDCEDFYVREAAAQAIEVIATDAKGYEEAQICISPLAKLLQTHDPDSQRLEQPYEAILEALGRLKAVSVQELIFPFLKHAMPRIRCAAARSMYGLTGDAHFAEQLVEKLADPDVNIRRMVLTDLGEIGYLPSASAIAQCRVENSFKLFALKSILDAHLPQANLEPSLSEPLQQIMLYMDDLL